MHHKQTLQVDWFTDSFHQYPATLNFGRSKNPNEKAIKAVITIPFHIFNLVMTFSNIVSFPLCSLLPPFLAPFSDSSVVTSGLLEVFTAGELLVVFTGWVLLVSELLDSYCIGMLVVFTNWSVLLASELLNSCCFGMLVVFTGWVLLVSKLLDSCCFGMLVVFIG